MRISPFRALRPPPALADRVASPPYDVISGAEARQLAAGRPDSFLHVIRPDIDLPPDVDPHDDRVYARARENFDDFRRRGLLVRDDEPALFVYRQVDGGHSQTGLVATCHVEDYERDVIKKHERTMPEKEDDRTRHVHMLDANAGPVFLTIRHHPDVEAALARVAADAPEVDFTADDGVRHMTWRVPDSAPFVDWFAAIPAAYVADGHHRSASAARVAIERREANPGHRGDESYNWFLTVLFPANQLRILAYNRVVKMEDGFDAAAFLRELGERFAVDGAAEPVPSAPREACVYAAGRWTRIRWEAAPGEDQVASLDVSVIQDRILAPLLGIDDPRTHPGVQFVGGIHGADRLQDLVDRGEGTVAFSLYPTTVNQLMDVADAGRIMPPKSTWFEPKLRSGLFVHVLD